MLKDKRARRLLAFDVAGAALTAAITLGLLATGLIASGVPPLFWCALGSIALCVAITGALWRRSMTPPMQALRRLAVANLAYAAASLGVIVAWRDTVTPLVVGYVLIEVLVLVALARAEWRAGARPE